MKNILIVVIAGAALVGVFSRWNFNLVSRASASSVIQDTLPKGVTLQQIDLGSVNSNQGAVSIIKDSNNGHICYAFGNQPNGSAGAGASLVCF